MYTVYILVCQDGSYYTGITTDLLRRFAEHQKGTGGAYTHSHKPLKVVYQESCPDRSSALRREALIKHFSHNQKIKLIADASLGIF